MRCWVWVVRPDQFRKCRWRPRPAFGGGWFKWVSQVGCDLLKKSVIVKCTIIESSVHRRPWTDARLDTYNWYRILFFGFIRARPEILPNPVFKLIQVKDCLVSCLKFTRISSVVSHIMRIIDIRLTFNFYNKV